MPSATVALMSSLLARIQSSSADLKTAQLIGAVSSVLNANENKSSEQLEISIKVYL